MKNIYTKTLSKCIAVATFLLLSLTTHAGIEPTSGRYVETKTDLSIKVIGGHLNWEREYRDRQWRFNKSWESLILVTDAATGNVESIRRADDVYKKLDSLGTTFKFGKRRTIRKQQDGTWLWKDRDGNTTKYDATGKTLSMHHQSGSKLTLMYNGDGKLSGALDSNDTQVLWVEYDLVSGHISKAKGYGNREVIYSWSLVDVNASPKRYKLVNVKDARGYDWQYAYASAIAKDGRVDVISMTDPEGRVTAMGYGGSGRATSMTNALGHTTNYQFDYIKSRKEFYLKATYPGGRVTETWYERDGELKRRDINGINIITITEDLRKDIETDTFGRVTTKEYDEFKNLIKTIYPDGTSTSTTYDVSNSNVLTQTDERGTVTKYEYWPNGRMKKMTEAFGTPVERSTEYIYDNFGQMLTKTQVGDAVTETAVTQYFYDAYGNVIKVVDAELNEEEFISHDSQGNNLIMIDGRDNPWTYGFDALGNHISEKNPLNEETKHEYDKVGNLVKTIYPDDSFVQFEYNPQNKIIKSIDELGYFRTTTYDQSGNKVSETDEMGRVTQYKYDLLNRKKEIEDGSGNKTLMEYPEVGFNSNYRFSIFQPILIKYPTYSQSLKYDLRGRLIEETLTYKDHLNQEYTETQKQKYDSAGNQIEFIDNDNNSSKAQYDELNRATKYIDALLKESVFVYDSRDNLIKFTDALNNSHLIEYNKINRKTRESRPMGQYESFVYNLNSYLSSLIDAKGQKTTFIYDASNRKTEINYFKNDQSLDKSVTFTYNSRGTLLTYNDGISQGVYTYDKAQQKLSEMVTLGAKIFNFAMTYHPDGQKATYTGIDGITYNYFYNNNGNLNNIVIPNEGNISFQDFKWEQPQEILFPGGVSRSQKYDGLKRVNTINVKDPTNQVLMNNIYSYTSTGNISNKNTEHGNYSYSYDNLNRLLSADYPTQIDEVFTYDALDNRKTDSNTGVNDWIYNQNNQLLNSMSNQFIFDDNGNQIEKKDSFGQVEKQYIYNTENRLSEIRDQNNQTLATYYYDPMGRRLSKVLTNPDKTTLEIFYHYTDEGLSAEVTGNQVTSYLFYAPNSWSTNPILKRQNDTYFYYQNDHMGRPQMIHNKQAQVVYSVEVSAFGKTKELVNTLSDNLGFPGQYYDEEKDSYYNLNRDYDYSIGRYTQSDPIALDGGANLFNYSYSNPVMNYDDTGLQVIPIPVPGLPAFPGFKPKPRPDRFSPDWGFPDNPSRPDTDTNDNTSEDDNSCKTCDDPPYSKYTECRWIPHYNFKKYSEPKRILQSRGGGRPNRQNYHTRGLCKGTPGEGFHETWRYSGRGNRGSPGSISSCDCCDDSKLSGPRIVTRYYLAEGW